MYRELTNPACVNKRSQAASPVRLGVCGGPGRLWASVRLAGPIWLDLAGLQISAGFQVIG